MTTQYKVFHSPSEEIRKKLHVILVGPEQGGNVGVAARAIKNMGILGQFFIVGTPTVLNEETWKFAKHAGDLVDRIRFFSTLEAAKRELPAKTLYLASTARVGSSSRPHPVSVGEAMPRSLEKLKNNEIEGLAFVFGCESDGLSNEDIALCDAVVTIPSAPEYRSINLGQSVLIFCYEANTTLNQTEPIGRVESTDSRPGQRQRLIENILTLAEEVGFILPGDPHKMRPRLEEIFSKLPPHIPEAKTLHGLLDQVRRSYRKGSPDMKGRYQWKLKEMELNEC